jgi:SprT-like family
MKLDNTSSDFYSCLEQIGNHFNRHLFDGNLPPILFTLGGNMKMLGHFRYANWSTGKDDVSEIILNADLFAYRAWIDLFKTVVHQQCHLYQCANESSSRPTYHNRRWAASMKDRGLIPSSTGKPGGAETGQMMGEYINAKGSFLKHSIALVEAGLAFPVTNRSFCNEKITIEEDLPLNIEQSIREKLLSPIGDSYEVESKNLIEKSNRKTKYVCGGCMGTVWGKPDLKIDCGKCDGMEYTVQLPPQQV